MDLLKVDTIEEAKEKIAGYCRDLLMETEYVPLKSMTGRVLAEDIRSAENIPPYRRSTMDGYAVNSIDTGAASDSVPSFLKVSCEVLMGEADTGIRVGPGCCIYVPTGGWVPDGADAVVMTEYCEAFGDGMLAVSKPAAPGENVVQVGEDIAEGEVVLKRGRKLKPQDVGVLAALGITEASVYIPWKITIISTGDELADPAEAPAQGQMRDINSYTIAAGSASEGFEVLRSELIKDDEESILNALEGAKADSDVIVISGGSSQGKKDMTADLIGRAADSGVITHGIAAKPGKPTITGFDSRSSTLFLGLPGHPAAALIIFEQLLIGLWSSLTGQPGERTVKARISMNVPSSPGRRTFQPVRLEEIAEGGIEAVPVFARSGMILPLSSADGYFEISENLEGVRAGDTVAVKLWK